MEDAIVNVEQPTVNVEEATVNVNGLITPAAAAVVPVFDHGFLYGEGIYETLRTYNHRPFLIDRHLRRLRASADRIGLSIPQSDDELTDSIASTMAHVGGEAEHYIRLLVTRGVGELSYDPTTCPQPTIVIIAKAHRENGSRGADPRDRAHHFFGSEEPPRRDRPSNQVKQPVEQPAGDAGSHTGRGAGGAHA